MVPQGAIFTPSDSRFVQADLNSSRWALNRRKDYSGRDLHQLGRSLVGSRQCQKRLIRYRARQFEVGDGLPLSHQDERRGQRRDEPLCPRQSVLEACLHHHLKNVLRDIKTDCANLLHKWLRACGSNGSALWHIAMPVRELSIASGGLKPGWACQSPFMNNYPLTAPAVRPWTR